MEKVPDHPVIRNMGRTGYPDGKEPTYPHCPICEAICEKVYRNPELEIMGCESCLKPIDAWDVPECFPEEED